ncbi:coiled-coil domain-containing protein 82-like isoform X2 [Ptychodera flava]|uniref:coiled-coil domain-containing protein 82-like isoform X2 n=1 Tax=Ptychodera flava TaxID=63121 RepID=UPI00396A700A
MHRNSAITRSRSRAQESSRCDKSTPETESNDTVNHQKGRHSKRPQIIVDSKGSSSPQENPDVETKKSCETNMVTRSRSRSQKSGKSDQPNDNITSESEGEIGHHQVNKRKRPPLIVDSTSESAECPSGESSHSETGKAPDIDTAADFTPTRTLRDRRKITSSGKKQKLMELRRLQRIRKRQNEKKAQRESEGKSGSPETSSITSNGRAKQSCENDNSIDAVNIPLKADSDSHTNNDCQADVTPLQNLPQETVRIPSEENVRVMLDFSGNCTQSSSKLCEVSDIVANDGDISDDELLLIQSAIASSLNDSHPSTSHDGAGIVTVASDAGAESSDSDVLPSRVKKARKIHVESEDDENNNQGGEQSGNSSPEELINDEDDDADLTDFIVDDDEELEDNQSIDDDFDDGGDDTAKGTANHNERELSFVVERELLSNSDDIMFIWLIEGKEMRKYVRETGDNDHHDDEDQDEDDAPPEIFQRTLEVSRYSNKQKPNYQRIDVCRYADDDNSCSADQDGGDVERVEVISWLTPCDEEPISPKAVMPMLPPIFSGGLRQVFEIYLQAMVSGAVDPDFLVCIYQEKDDYFLPALYKVDDTLNDRKMFLVKSQAWIDIYKKAVEKYPYMYEENSLAYLGSPCQACGLKDRYASTDVMFGGSPYNRTTMEDLESDEYDCVRREYQDWDVDSDFSDSYKSFEDWFGDYGEYGEIRGEHWYVGRCCYKRSKLYHSLHHYKWSLMKNCKEKVEYHRLVRPQIQKNQLIEVIMDDDSWVESVYDHLKDTLDSTCEYTSDGKDMSACIPWR